MLTYTITSQDHCRRLESFLRMLIPSAPAAYPRKLIKNGAVRVNNLIATPDLLLSIDDTVAIKESGTLTSLLEERRPPLDLLYEDSRIIIVNKPAGLAMHRTAEQEGDLVQQGTVYMTRRGTPCKLYPVNRLDRGTSGAVILAKSSASAGLFGRQVKETGLDKLYLALVRGRPQRLGVVDQPLDGKESETRYELLAEGQGASLLAVVPISGRMHQIRRHLEMDGHPIIGDKRYGDREMPDLPGFALHSFRTVLILPEVGPLTVCAPLPEELLLYCQRVGIDRLSLLRSVRRLADCRTC